MKKLITFFLPVFLISDLCYGQIRHFFPTQNEIPLPVQSLTAENGLPQGFVDGIVQDSTGFIWMSTKAGLVRYDGYQAKVFKNDPADSNSLRSNIILSLYLDRQNQLWLCYDDHTVDIFNPVTQIVKHVDSRSSIGKLFQGTYMQPPTLFEDSRHRYWVISPDMQSLHYFIPDSHTVVRITVPDGERIMAIAESEGKIWVCSTQSLYVFVNENSCLRQIAPLPPGINYQYYRTSAMIRDTQGNWIIGNRGCALIYTPYHQWHVIHTPFPDQPVRFIVKAPDGSIYLNAGNQVFRLQYDSTYILSPVWINKAHPGNLESLLVDRSNVMWAGTNTFGVRLLNLASNGFHSFTYQDGFIPDIFHALQLPVKNMERQTDVNMAYKWRYTRDSEGNLWFIKPFPHDAKRKLQKGILPLYKWDGKNFSILPVKTGSSQWVQLAFDDEGQCWAILFDKDNLHCLLAKVDLSSGTIRPIKHLPHLFNESAFLISTNHQLCLVYSKELQLYNPQTGQSRHYLSHKKFHNATLLMAVNDPVNDSILWIASNGSGLIRFNTHNGAVQYFTEKEGIPGNTVYAILTDKHGYLWCSSNKGIFRFSPDDHHVLSFTIKDGLQGNEFNRYHFLKTIDGHFIFGGTKGWTSFYPDSIHTDDYHPPVMITGISVNNKPLEQWPSWKDSIVTTMRSLTLDYNQNFLTFSFAGLEYNHTGRLLYRYQLKGIDKSRVITGTSHTAHYTNLSPGTYTFRINAANTSGIWSPGARTMQVIILPPWWKTWWAYLLYGFIAVVVLWLLFRYRLNRIQIKNEILLKEKEAEHLKQVDEMKSRFFSNITHEFRTPLSLIIGPLEQINKGTGTGISPVVRKKISDAQRNARQLLRLINQLLDMSKVEADNMRISLSRGELHTFITDHMALFAGQAEQKKIQLHFENKVTGEYLFDADKWQKILSNLLSNAIKFTPAGGNIQVSLSQKSHQEKKTIIFLTVRDNGAGIAKENLPFIFNRFYQADDTLTRTQGGAGIGLALTKELAELMGGKIEVKSEPEKGTTFNVSIPVKKATHEKVPLVQKIKADGIPSALNTTNKTAGLSRKDIPLVMVVEDNQELNQFIVQTLEKDYRTLTAYNGKEALSLAKKQLPDMIISDIMMPEMDGYTLCARIKQNDLTSHIAFILLSARSSHDSVIRGLKNYADDYLIKPFHPDELLLRIHNLLERQQKLKEHYQRQLTLPDQPVETNKITDPFLLRLYDIIEENIDNTSLDVEMLAEKMTVSRRTLNRKIDMLTGLSASRIIKQYRLKKAARWLQSGRNVSEAAYHSGFATPAYFSVSFKEFYGMTPSDYIHNHKF